MAIDVKFNVGNKYHTYDNNVHYFTVTKRTKHYITIDGPFTGRYWVYRRNRIPGTYEYIKVRADNMFDRWFCADRYLTKAEMK